MLEFSVTLDKKYQNLTRGLLGNFNNIKTDDFICQNGTRLPDNSTERILYQFGQSCNTKKVHKHRLKDNY